MKKGFTLIELLAVIVILAIIALIATPIILNIIETTRKEAFVQTAQSIIDSAEYYYTDNIMIEENITEDTIIEFPNVGQLKFDGEIPKNGKVIINPKGKIAIAINNGTYCVRKGFYDNNIETTKEIDECIIPSSGTVKNLFYKSGTITSEQNGVTILYDETTQIYTLNGTTNNIGNIILAKDLDIPLDDDTDVIWSRHIVGGSITFTENAYLLYSIFNDDNSKWFTNRIDERTSTLTSLTVSKNNKIPKRTENGMFIGYIQCLGNSGIIFNNFQIKLVLEENKT